MNTQHLTRLQHNLNWEEALEWVSIWMSGGGLLLGLSILGWDVVAWLKHGEWVTTRGWWVLTHTVGVPEYLTSQPTSWVGLHKLATFFVNMPAAFSLPVLGASLSWVFSGMVEDHYEWKKKEQEKAAEAAR